MLFVIKDIWLFEKMSKCQADVCHISRKSRKDGENRVVFRSDNGEKIRKYENKYLTHIGKNTKRRKVLQKKMGVLYSV